MQNKKDGCWFIDLKDTTQNESYFVACGVLRIEKSLNVKCDTSYKYFFLFYLFVKSVLSLHKLKKTLLLIPIIIRIIESMQNKLCESNAWNEQFEINSFYTAHLRKSAAVPVFPSFVYLSLCRCTFQLHFKSFPQRHSALALPPLLLLRPPF